MSGEKLDPHAELKPFWPLRWLEQPAAPDLPPFGRFGIANRAWAGRLVQKAEVEMAWMITAEDRHESVMLRQDKALMARMWEWELSLQDRILAAGSLRTDDGATPVGSLMILDVASRAEAEAIWATDPATLAGMRQPPVIRFWNPAILQGEVQP